MKKLLQFMVFDCEAFFKDKVLNVIDKRIWKSYETGEILGAEYEIGIQEDHTKYRLKDGESATNRYDKFKAHIEGRTDMPVPIDAIVKLVNPRGRVSGDFKNQLTVIVDDLEVVSKR
mgnify:CR=1 FL=1